MRPSESFVGQPVRALQTMLRVIAMESHKASNVIPDGIYGHQTMDAVKDFQQSQNLPATGIVNNETWDRIVDAYEPAMVNQSRAQSISTHMNGCIHSGESSPSVMLAQAMLHTVGEQFHCVEMPTHSGTLDSQTERSLRSFQIVCDLPSTGDLDKGTWKHLCLQFSLAANPNFKKRTDIC